MATLSRIADALAAADGRRGSTTISNLARTGREEGFTAATGVLAVREAVDLLLAVAVPLAAANRRETVAAAAQFRTLHPLEGQSFPVPGRVGTFGEALALLIEAAPTLDPGVTVELSSAPLARVVFGPMMQVDFIATAGRPRGPFRQREPSDLTMTTRIGRGTLLRLHDALGVDE